MKNKLSLLSFILLFGFSIHSFVIADSSPHGTIPSTEQVYLPLINNFIPTATHTPTATATPTLVPTSTPVHAPTATATQLSNPAGCDPSYPTVCIPPPPPDLDCREILYKNFKVLPPDPHGFDGDNDGWGCEK